MHFNCKLQIVHLSEAITIMLLYFSLSKICSFENSLFELVWVHAVRGPCVEVTKCPLLELNGLSCGGSYHRYHQSGLDWCQDYQNRQTQGLTWLIEALVHIHREIPLSSILNSYNYFCNCNYFCNFCNHRYFIPPQIVYVAQSTGILYFISRGKSGY